MLLLSNSQSSVASAHLHADAGETLIPLRLPAQAGHGLQLGDVRAADNDYVGVTGTFLGTAAQGVWSTARLTSRCRRAESRSCTSEPSGSIPGLVQQSAGTLDLYSMHIRASAFEGECNDVNCTDVFTTGVDASGQSPALRSQPQVPLVRGQGQLCRGSLSAPVPHR